MSKHLDTEYKVRMPQELNRSKNVDTVARLEATFEYKEEILENISTEVLISELAKYLSDLSVVPNKK